MPKRERLIALLMLVALASSIPQVTTAQEAKLWASKSSVTIDEGIELNLFWSDVGCPEYHVVFLRTYPNGTTLRIPAEGYGEALGAPGVSGIKLRFDGEKVGRHAFRYELYCGTSHLATSNEVQVVVSKGVSSLELRVRPERVLRGEEVELSGLVTPKLRGRLTLEVISPSGSRRQIELAFDGNFSHRIALNESGSWRFRASWEGNDEYSGASSDWVSAYVEVSPLRVEVTTDPPGLRVYVDGRAYDGGGEFSWVEGSSHNLSVEPLITLDGRRYVFAGWRGRGNSTSLSIEVRRPEVYVAEYRVQYYLNVTSELGEAEGSGWYDAGSYARASLKRGEVKGEFPWLYVFSGWEGDAKGRELTSEPILMDGPKLAVARWERRIEPYALALIAASVLAMIFGSSSLYLLLKYRRLSRSRRTAGEEDERVRRIKERILRLEEMRRRGEVPERVYRRLREEYSMELRRLREGRRKGGVRDR